jgi:hypothetical protein
MRIYKSRRTIACKINESVMGYSDNFEVLQRKQQSKSLSIWTRRIRILFSSKIHCIIIVIGSYCNINEWRVKRSWKWLNLTSNLLIDDPVTLPTEIWFVLAIEGLNEVTSLTKLIIIMTAVTHNNWIIDISQSVNLLKTAIVTHSTMYWRMKQL